MFQTTNQYIITYVGYPHGISEMDGFPRNLRRATHSVLLGMAKGPVGHVNSNCLGRKQLKNGSNNGHKYEDSNRS
jgi:hypothetical protein